MDEIKAPLIIFLEDEFADRVQKGFNQELKSYKDIIKSIDKDADCFGRKYGLAPVLQNTPYVYNPYTDGYLILNDNIDFSILQNKMRCITSVLRYMGAVQVEIKALHIRKVNSQTKGSISGGNLAGNANANYDNTEDEELKQKLYIFYSNDLPQCLSAEKLKLYIQSHGLDQDQLIQDKFFEYENGILSGLYTERIEMKSNLSSALEIGASLEAKGGFNAKCNFSFSKNYFLQIDYEIRLVFPDTTLISS